ncbi:hypothetical protein R5R35_004829 [Gryllus longicercus]|uniref:Uncharacterized protein n=2 Tax=Gryllus longicercus TaxID=2509291 RepID=A0AAN9Z9D6_9ORTH
MFSERSLVWTKQGDTHLAMGVIDPCTQAAFQTENGSSAVEHAATASAADAYSSLVKGKYLL